MDFTPETPNPWKTTRKSQSIVYQLAIGEMTAEEVCLSSGMVKRTSGLAWASRREILEEHGLYDACIVGSGDIGIFSAALGVFDHFARIREMNARRTEHYVAWAKPYFDKIRGRVGYIPGRVFHLWHCDLNDRGHLERDGLFARFDFDPYTDIALDPNGCWREF